MLARLREERPVRLLIPAAASVFVMAFVLAFGRRDSMWTDELYSAWAVDRPLGELLSKLVTDEPNQAPYYVALWFWAQVKHGDLWLRSFSAFGTIAAIWGIWVLARRWSGTLAAALAVGVFALSPFVLSWSMQARGYSMLMATTIWSVVIADRFLDRRTRRLAVGLGVLVGLTMALQFAAAFPMLGLLLVLALLVRRDGGLRSVALTTAIAAAVFLPFALVGVRHTDHLKWVPDLSIDSIREQFGVLVNGPLWILLVLAGLALAVRAIRRGTLDQRVWLTIAAALIGFFGVLFESAVYQPMFISRYLAPCVPLALVAASAGWVSLSRRDSTIMAGVVGIVATVTFVVAFDNTRTAVIQDNRSAAAHLRANMREGDSIVPNLWYLTKGIDRYWAHAMTGWTLVDLDDSDMRADVLVTPTGRSIHPDRLWVVIGDTPRRTDWDSENFPALLDLYPNVIESEQFGTLTLELRTR